MAAAPSDLLDTFGYAFTRLVPRGSGDGLVCAEAVAAGSPLLTLPLSRCWTADRARRCKLVARELGRAASRNPGHVLLKADETWISLHLLHERGLGSSAEPAVQAHVALLERTAAAQAALPDWTASELAALEPSAWATEASRWSERVAADFRGLAAELGPAALEALRLDEAGYRWARGVLQRHALHVLQPATSSGSLLLLAPGLELLEPDDNTLPTAGALRLLPPTSPALGEMLVLSACRGYAAGDAVGLAHFGFACSNGRRLMSCGRPLSTNPWDSVDVPVQFSCADPSQQAVQSLSALLDASGGLPLLHPGDCLPADVADGCSAVQVSEDGGRSAVHVTFRCSRRRPLPARASLSLLGLALLGDFDRLPEIMSQEGDAHDVYGSEQSARRGLVALRAAIGERLASYPTEQAPPSQVGGGSRGCDRYAAEVVASERSLLAASLEAADSVLSGGSWASGGASAAAPAVCVQDGSEPQSVAAGEPFAGAGDSGAMYALDWDDAAEDGAGASHGGTKPSRWRHGEATEGVSWNEAANLALMGWSPPLLCDVGWQETPKPEVRDRLPREQTAMLEVKGCRLQAAVEKDLKKRLQCSARYTFDSKQKQFQLASGGLEDGYDGPLHGTDVLLVPIPPAAYADAPLDALATEVLLLLQAVFQVMETEKRYISVMLLTRGASGPILSGMKGPSPGCPLRGVVRVAKIELPMLHVQMLDSDAFFPTEGGARGEELASQVARELDATDGTLEVAYRAGARFCPRLRLSARNRLRAGQAPAPRLCWGLENGVAVITGGLGGLGIISAEALVEAGVQTVVLCSRSGRVARDGQGLAERLEVLVQSGARVVQEQCDTSSESQVEALLQRVRALGAGPLRIIIHAAGILDDKMFVRHDAESMRKSFAPKADGAWYLHKHSLQDSLDAFLCYSSVSSNFGHPGQANYSSANTYMDELCRWRASQGRPSTSIMWPGIKEVGMAAKMLESDVNGEHGIGIAVVKKVVRQVVAGSAPIEAVQAVCPAGQLVPRLRHQASMLEPLLEDFFSRLAVVDGEVRCKAFGGEELLPVLELPGSPAAELAALHKQNAASS